jgi:starch phosphorylase
MHNDPDIQSRRDAEFLYDVLEKEVIPLYYEREADGIPHQWIRRIKSSMQSLGWRFSADRMVTDYAMRFYLPAAGSKSADTV